MRKLGPLVALALLASLSFAPAADAAWSTPTTVNDPYFAATSAPKVLFDRSGTGGTLLDPGSSFVIRTGDNGATWPGVPLGFSGVPGSNFTYGTHGAGQRVWAWAYTGSKIRMQRTGPGAVPTTGSGTEVATGGQSALAIAVNSSGDALVAWTSTGARTAGTVFWKAGEGAPRAPQTLAPVESGSGGASIPTPFLDDGGGAAVVWNHAITGGQGASQAYTADIANTPFSTPTTLTSNGFVIANGGGQAADGRAIVVLRREQSIPANTYGVTTALTSQYATRAPGGAFGPPTPLDGDDDHATDGENLSVGSDGAVAIGWRNTANWTGDHVCSDLFGIARSRAAVGKLTAGGGISLSTTTFTGAGQSGAAPKVAAGTDARTAAWWEATVDCGPPSVRISGFAYSADSSGLADAGATPAYKPSALTFNHCGQLLAFGIPSGAGSKFSVSTYDAAPALDCNADPGGEPGGGNPGGGSADGGSNQPPAAAFTAKLGKFKSLKGGKATAEVGVAGAAAIAAAVLFKGKPAVKSTKKTTAAGTVKFSFKLKGAALKQLKKKKKLKLKTTFTITPASGAAPTTLSKSVTFIK